MDYNNDLYKILRKISESCEYHHCYNCPFEIEDMCCIEDLFYDLTIYSPVNYEDVYIKWFNKWEAKYNELYQ